MSRRRAFTLVEILVVIGVIVLLVGLTVAVIPVVTAQSGKRETESVLKILDQALQAWELAADRKITIGSGDGFDLNVDELDVAGDELETHTRRLSQLLTIIRRNGHVSGILAQVSPELLQYDASVQYPAPAYRLVDAWGLPIVTVFPGNPWAPGDDPARRDEDGTYQTDDEQEYGIARGRRTGFVSAGPDGRFGKLHLHDSYDGLSPDEKKEVVEAEDNLSSYELLETRP